MISTLIAIPYKLARAPLAVIDSGLSERLPEESLPRTVLDRVLGSSDKVAGTLLSDMGLFESGVERLERSRTLRMAAKRENEAEQYRRQAHETVVDARDEAAQKRQAAEEHAEEMLDVADVVEARTEREARAEAKSAEAAKKDAADRKAAQRETTIEQRKQRAEAGAAAKREAAQREAKAKIDHARETDRSAAEARADADRLNDLAEAKKRERKQA